MRPRTTWLLFAAALTVVLGFMGWATVKLLELESDRARAERQALLEEQIRLALWRMETSATSIVSREIAEVGVARDPAASLPRGVLVRFTVHPSGEVELDGLADEEALDGFVTSLEGGEVFARLQLPPLQIVLPAPVEQDNDRGVDLLQSSRSANEWSKRRSSVQSNIDSYTASVSNTIGKLDPLEGISSVDGKDAQLDSMRPLWVGDRLVLARRKAVAGGTLLEGSLLDWPAVRRDLLEEVTDLLPAAELEPALEAAPQDAGRLLATLPVRLLPGSAGVVLESALSPLEVSLIVGWVFVLTASLAVVALLRWSMALSERRAAFVSTVTHELRTPLTTLRMYAEMLEQGMVEDKRQRYLATLRREADRLGTLVENVLAYARIESERLVDRSEDMALDGLLEPIVPRLREHAEAAGMHLEVAIAREAERTIVRVDPTAIEQILFNLVDNATKYATSEGESRLFLQADKRGDRVELRVRDFGPGIAEKERRRIFEPFAKATEHAAGSKPGVGLGLALCRRLAVHMGGTLEIHDAHPGALFVLSFSARAVT